MNATERSQPRPSRSDNEPAPPGDSPPSSGERTPPEPLEIAPPKNGPAEDLPRPPVGGMAAALGAAPISIAPAFAEKFGGPRFWALPDKNLGWWILRENDLGGAEGLHQSASTIAIPNIAPGQRGAVEAQCRDFIAARLRDRWHEDSFNLIKRLMLGGVFCIAGFIGLRFLEVFDFPVLLAALGYTAYAAIRYGTRFVRSMDALEKVPRNFTAEAFAVSPLLERLARALDFRRNQPFEKRGELPDKELLDANAYRTLIREGVTTRDELAALGRAVETRFEVKLDHPKSLGELSRAEGLDPESAALYRDLALAAAEIAFDPEFN